MDLLVASSTFKENMPFFFLLFRNTSFKLWCYAVCVKIAACRLDIDSLVKHTSHTRSVIDAGTSAVDVAPGKGVVCWRASCIYLLSRAQSAEASTCFSSL